MENNQNQNIDLPENAFRELKDGEEYKPVMSPQETYREVSPWSITWGILMAVLFSAAAAYLVLILVIFHCLIVLFACKDK